MTNTNVQTKETNHLAGEQTLLFSPDCLNVTTVPAIDFSLHNLQGDGTSSPNMKTPPTVAGN